MLREDGSCAFHLLPAEWLHNLRQSSLSHPRASSDAAALCARMLHGFPAKRYTFGMLILTRQSTLLGIASWFVPFAVSFLFFDRTGQLTIPQPLFKSLMVVVGGGVGTALLVHAFRSIAPTARNGLMLGTYWFGINLLLDLLFLVPMAKMTVGNYLVDIGLRYLMLPIVAIGIGLVAGRGRS